MVFRLKSLIETRSPTIPFLVTLYLSTIHSRQISLPFLLLGSTLLQLSGITCRCRMHFPLYLLIFSSSDIIMGDSDTFE